MSGSRMHHEARRLVDHDKMLVFKHHIKGNVFGLGFCGNRRRQGNGNCLTCLEFGAAIELYLPLDKHLPLGDKPLEACPADLGEGLGQKAVKALWCFGDGVQCLRGRRHMTEDMSNRVEDQIVQPKPPKALLRLVYIMGIILVLLFLTLIVGIIWKAQHRPPPPRLEVPVELGIDPAKVRLMNFNGNLLALTTDTELVVIDVNKRQVILRSAR